MAREIARKLSQGTSRDVLILIERGEVRDWVGGFVEELARVSDFDVQVVPADQSALSLLKTQPNGQAWYLIDGELSGQKRKRFIEDVSQTRGYTITEDNQWGLRVERGVKTKRL